MRVFLKFAIISITIVLGACAALAQGRCPAGYGACPDRLGGGCAPIGNVCCDGGTNAPPGSVCCGNGKYCDAGELCGQEGKCIPRSSPRVCANGKSYCDPGYRCVAGNKCRAESSSRRRESGSNDNSSGVRDARHCLSVTNSGNSAYVVRNGCTFGVNFRIQTMDFSPRKTSTDALYLGANGSMTTFSYFRFTPVIVSACGYGSAC